MNFWGYAGENAGWSRSSKHKCETSRQKDSRNKPEQTTTQKIQRGMGIIGSFLSIAGIPISGGMSLLGLPISVAMAADNTPPEVDGDFQCNSPSVSRTRAETLTPKKAKQIANGLKIEAQEFSARALSPHRTPIEGSENIQDMIDVLGELEAFNSTVQDLNLSNKAEIQEITDSIKSQVEKYTIKVAERLQKQAKENKDNPDPSFSKDIYLEQARKLAEKAQEANISNKDKLLEITDDIIAILGN
jgi:hypothetical protein